MLRQRLRTRPGRGLVGRFVLTLVACSLVWYGLMLVLLAVKVSPSTVDGLSGYRSAYDFLERLGPSDFDGATRAIVAGAALLAFLILGLAAWRAVPRPELARHEIDLHADDHGEVVVSPRAVERMAEISACRVAGVAAAHGRWGGDAVDVGISASRARGLDATLREVQARVAEGLGTHGLPSVPVNVTLTGFQRRTRRELN